MPQNRPSKRRLLLDRRGGRDVAALLVGGRLHDVLVDPGGALKVGEIWSARIDKPASRAEGGGVFLDLGGERGFLPGRAPGAMGDFIKVEIKRAREEGKAALVSTKLDFAGAYLAHTPATPGVNVSRKIGPEEQARLKAALAGLERHGGFVARTSAAGVDAAELRADAEAQIAAAAEVDAASARPPRMLRAAESLEAQARRLWPDAAVERGDPSASADARPLAVHGVEEALRLLLGPRVPLEGPGLSGAWLAMERTAAVIAIDVNAGASAVLSNVNAAALAEIPRQLRLRGWGGQIVIDLATAERRDSAAAQAERAALADQLATAAKGTVKVLGFGPLGLLEAQRRRDRTPLENLLTRADLDDPNL